MNWGVFFLLIYLSTFDLAFVVEHMYRMNEGQMRKERKVEEKMETRKERQRKKGKKEEERTERKKNRKEKKEAYKPTRILTLSHPL